MVTLTKRCLCIGGVFTGILLWMLYRTRTNRNSFPQTYLDIVRGLSETERDQILRVPSYTCGEYVRECTMSKTLKRALVDHWYRAPRVRETKNGHVDGTCSLVELSSELKRAIEVDAFRRIASWTKRSDWVHTSTYGLRGYGRGSTLKYHVDRAGTHTVSAVYHVCKDAPWTLVGYEPNGTRHEITFDRYDVLLYESEVLVHGRPDPYTGRAFVNAFVHFTLPDPRVME